MLRQLLSNKWLCLGLASLLSLYAWMNPTDTARRAVSTLEKADIETVVIQREDGVEMIFEKKLDDTNTWEMRSPNNALANTAMLEKIFAMTDQKSRYRHTLSKESQRDRYALNPPKVTLFLNDQQFDFGKTNAFNQHRFVLHDGTVHTLKDRIYPVLIAPVDDFLQGALTPARSETSPAEITPAASSPSPSAQ